MASLSPTFLTGIDDVINTPCFVLLLANGVHGLGLHTGITLCFFLGSRTWTCGKNLCTTVGEMGRLLEFRYGLPKAHVRRGGTTGGKAVGLGINPRMRLVLPQREAGCALVHEVIIVIRGSHYLISITWIPG